ncbi:MAG TPA: roadblock/LC7 domain-containing protein [Candidatus Polarisedimenticolia bacterium]|jgi:predicted regulator of Ras-like GTPase activity (Roadblock/LC7/MglB family)|nr:roadblock/LC7 domain-containing protein [Candidatus Polarisedimenticolia bacterium]
MFKEVLQGLVSRVDEARGAAIVGVDGIPLEEHARGSLDLEKFAAECTTLIKSAAETGKALDQGTAREVVLRCDAAQTILRSLSGDYFLCLVLGPAAPLGRARYELQKACSRLEGELG